MGKKSDKTKDHSKVPSAISHDSRSDRDSRKSPAEPYICTGDFSKDFTELSYRAGLVVVPPVVPRPKVIPPHEPKVETKGKSRQVEVEVEPELTEDGEPIEHPPKTFLLKNCFEYFKPCVQVELEHNEKYDTVSELYIRGWKIDESMLNTLRLCLPLSDKLHTINLWNTGLTGEIMTMMGILLPQCANVKTLVLDNNPTTKENYFVFLSEHSNLVHLSLRYCGITHVGAEPLANALGNTFKYNNKLLSLNLSGNSLGDQGAIHIATALRTNRQLLVLNLASNNIGDKGICKLAESLSRFALTHLEVVERRKLTSTYVGSPDRVNTPLSSRRAESRDRPSSGRSQQVTKRDKSSKKKLDAKGKESKEDTKTKKDDKKDKKGGDTRGARGSIVPEPQTKGLTKTKDTKKGKKEKSSTPHEQELTDVPESVNALVDQVDYIDSELWIGGNLALVSLNLARNQCTEIGCAAFLKAIQYQTTMASENRHSNANGLMRLVLNKNCINEDSASLQKLTDLMITKDPFYKPKTPEEEVTEPPAKG